MFKVIWTLAEQSPLEVAELCAKTEVACGRKGGREGSDTSQVLSKPGFPALEAGTLLRVYGACGRVKWATMCLQPEVRALGTATLFCLPPPTPRDRQDLAREAPGAIRFWT